MAIFGFSTGVKPSDSMIDKLAEKFLALTWKFGSTNRSLPLGMSAS